MQTMTVWRRAAVAALVLGLAAGACAKKPPPIARPMPPPPPPAAPAASAPQAAPQPVAEAPLAPPIPVPPDDPVAARSLDELNRDSPLAPAFFAYDSAELDAQAQGILEQNAAVLKRYPTWAMTIEGHCDERGTAEYNLALGERRALTARNYLVSLGVPGERLRTVSYGKEFPFDAGHDEAAWARNRRAHFVITAK